MALAGLYTPKIVASVSSGATEAAGTSSGPRFSRWSMVINLRRCDGCVGLNKPPQCTQSCITGHQAPVGMQWIQVYEYKFEHGGSYFLPAPCMMCENSPCTNVCPVGATFTTPEGLVLIDQQRCIGCRLCMAACPYQRRFFNWGTPKVPPQESPVEYSVETQRPAIKGTVMKCDFCADMARAGVVPFCVSGCPRKAIWYGDLELDMATNSEDVVKLSRFLAHNQAYRFNEELGTQPRVYYVPGHGQDVGRSPFDSGLLEVTWPGESQI